MLIGKTAIVRAVGLLAGSAAAAQAIAIITLPLVTRLYSPSDFGTFATYSAIVGTAAVVACGRMELAIPLAADEEDARDIGATAFTILFFYSVLASLLCVCAWILSKQVPLFVLLIPLGIFSTGLLSIGQYRLLRFKNFALIAKARIAQSSITSLIQVVAGALSAATWGLIGSQIVGNLAASLVQSTVSAKLPSHVHRARRLTVFNTLRKYKNYWRYSAPEALTNTAAIQAPLVLIATYASAHEAGYLLLAMKLLQVPVSLFAGSISQVYYAHAGEEEEKGNLAAFTAKTLSSIAKIGVGPIIFAAIVSPKLIPLIFGADWVGAGALVPWLSGWFACQLLAAPISTVMQTKGLQRNMLKITVIGFLFRFGGAICAILFLPRSQGIAYGLSGFVFYLACLFFFCRAAEINISRLIGIVLGSIPWILPWLFGGALIVLLVK